MSAGTLPRTLSRYVARRLLLAVLIVFAATISLVFVVDFVELLRRSGDNPEASLSEVILLAAERAPSLTERALPFAVLFAAMGAFLQLSRKLELVVARAAGVSVWQILAPAVVVAVALGVLATTVYNPVSAALAEAAATLEARLLRGSTIPQETDLRYFRQRSVDGESIIRAEHSSERGRVLSGIRAFVFSQPGVLQETVEAARAVLRNGFWELSEVRVTRPGREPETHNLYQVATNLTPDQVAESLTPVHAISFWDLPETVQLARNAGLPVAGLELQHQALLARPALLAAMVLIAATVSFRFFRFGGVARVILIGVIAGFVLYVVTKLAEDFGAAGFMRPAVAAWAPAVVGGLMSVTVLLFQEDG